MLLRFRSTQEGSLCEKILAVKQEGSVAEFRRTFKTLAAPVVGLTEEVLESTFINGLKPEIKVEVRLLSPIGLGQLMEVAQKVEDRNLALKALWETLAQKIIKLTTTPNRWVEKKPEAFPTRTVMVGEKFVGPRREYTTKRMSDSEWQLRREKGLGFCCDEKYTMGHQCKNRELKALLVQEGEQLVDEEDEPPEEQLVLLRFQSLLDFAI